MPPRPAVFEHLSLGARQVVRVIEQKRFLALLHKGSTKLKVDGYDGFYSGEMNEKREAFGEGKFYNM